MAATLPAPRILRAPTALGAPRTLHAPPTTLGDACALLAQLPVPAEQCREPERCLVIVPAPERRGTVFRAEQRLAGSCSIFRRDDAGLFVLVASDEPFTRGSLAGRLEDAGLTLPMSWDLRLDLCCASGFDVPADEDAERVIDVALAAMRTIAGAVPTHGYAVGLREQRRPTARSSHRRS